MNYQLNNFFVNQKNITLSFVNRIMKKYVIHINLSQKLLMSFIFYLFFHVSLLKLIDRSNVRVMMINFINNINLLTYDKSTEMNCVALKKCMIFACNKQNNTTLFLHQKNMN